MRRAQRHPFHRLLATLVTATLFAPVAHGVSSHLDLSADLAESMVPAMYPTAGDGHPVDCSLCLSSTQLRAALERGGNEGLQLPARPVHAGQLPAGSPPQVRVSATGPRSPPLLP